MGPDDDGASRLLHWPAWPGDLAVTGRPLHWTQQSTRRHAALSNARIIAPCSMCLASAVRLAAAMTSTLATGMPMQHTQVLADGGATLQLGIAWAQISPGVSPACVAVMEVPCCHIHCCLHGCQHPVFTTHTQLFTDRRTCYCTSVPPDGLTPAAAV